MHMKMSIHQQFSGFQNFQMICAHTTHAQHLAFYVCKCMQYAFYRVGFQLIEKCSQNKIMQIERNPNVRERVFCFDNVKVLYLHFVLSNSNYESFGSIHRSAWGFRSRSISLCQTQ